MAGINSNTSTRAILEPMSSEQRLVLIICVLASFVAFLDGSVINVALPAIAKEFGGDLTVQQWVVDAYLITLGSLMLVAGSISDLFGRKKVLQVGLLGFGLTSVLCAVAPNAILLIIARGLQGIAGALLVPSSLALIISSFRGPAQAKAIGSWTAWTGIAFIVGPLAGGLLVDIASWRLIFAINILPIAYTLRLMRHLETSDQPRHTVRLDVIGAVLCAIGLGGPVYALIEQPHFGWTSPAIYIPLAVGTAAITLFILHEHRAEHPMLPLKLFSIRNFAAGNAATIAIYGGLSIATFLLSIFMQQVGHYPATIAGLALMPVTILMFVLSSRFGALAGTYGPRLFMTAGPLIAAVGFLTMLGVGNSVAYLTLLPGIVLFGIGLSITVAPLTAAILGSISSQQAGIGSAVNNAVARVAGLVAIAAVGPIIGKNITLNGFKAGITLTATLLTIGGLISVIGIKNAITKDTN